jgi:murein L,D-transpeptidase YafK
MGIPFRIMATAVAVMLAFGAWGNGIPTADRVVVIKSERKLILIKDTEPYREYKIALGSSPQGHKFAEGDERTPEGFYQLDWRNENSRFYKSIHVSYPNASDRAYARAKSREPGNNIMIHGLPNDSGWADKVLDNFDWTDGCIGVSNSAMDEIWQAVEEGTPILILP